MKLPVATCVVRVRAGASVEEENARLRGLPPCRNEYRGEYGLCQENENKSEAVI